MVSYAATCVVSAVTACDYLGRVFSMQVPGVPIDGITSASFLSSSNSLP
jgi:hypothetical protein